MITFNYDVSSATFLKKLLQLKPNISSTLLLLVVVNDGAWHCAPQKKKAAPFALICFGMPGLYKCIYAYMNVSLIICLSDVCLDMNLFACISLL